jgi:hypothetical protein
MPRFIISFSKRDIAVIAGLAALLIIEVSALFLLVYLSRFPVVIALFVKTLKLLTPVFLFLNIVFIVSTMLLKGKALIASSWREYLDELLRFAMLSLLITLGLIVLCSFAGTIIGLTLRKFAHIHSVGQFLAELKAWVSQNCY